AGVQAAEDALDAATRQLDDANAALREQAVQAYIRIGTTPSLGELVQQTGDIAEVPRLAMYVEVAAERHAEVVAEHRRLQEDTTTLEAAASAAKAEVAARRQQVVDRKA